MSGSNVGTIKLVEYYGTRNDLPIEGPIKGLFTGSSVTHSAAMMEFSESALKPELIARLQALKDEGKIFFRENVDKRTGQKSYELYYSFWPKEAWDPISKSSRMENPTHDAQISQTGSPMKYGNERLKNYLQPATAEFRSSIPILKYLLPSHVETLPPSIMISLTPLEHTYKGSTQAAVEFAQAYAAWNRASVQHSPNEAKANELMLQKQYALQAAMGLKDKSHEDFMRALEPFVTFGVTPLDSVSLPLTNDPREHSALQLEPMILKILEVAENPEKHPYNLATNNCANQTLDLLQSGVSQHASTELKIAMGITPVFGIHMAPPLVFPGRVTRVAADASHVIEKEQRAKMEGDKENQGVRGNLQGHGSHHALDHHTQHDSKRLRPDPSATKTKNNTDHESGHQQKSASGPKHIDAMSTRLPPPPFAGTTGSGSNA